MQQNLDITIGVTRLSRLYRNSGFSFKWIDKEESVVPNNCIVYEIMVTVNLFFNNINNIYLYRYIIRNILKERLNLGYKKSS